MQFISYVREWTTFEENAHKRISPNTTERDPIVVAASSGVRRGNVGGYIKLIFFFYQTRRFLIS